MWLNSLVFGCPRSLDSSQIGATLIGSYWHANQYLQFGVCPYSRGAFSRSARRL